MGNRSTPIPGVGVREARLLQIGLFSPEVLACPQFGNTMPCPSEPQRRGLCLARQLLAGMGCGAAKSGPTRLFTAAKMARGHPLGAAPPGTHELGGEMQGEPQPLPVPSEFTQCPWKCLGLWSSSGSVPCRLCGLGQAP